MKNNAAVWYSWISRISGLNVSRTLPTSYVSIVDLKARYWPESGRYVLMVHIRHTPCPSSSAIVCVLRCLPLQEMITVEIALLDQTEKKKAFNELWQSYLISSKKRVELEASLQISEISKIPTQIEPYYKSEMDSELYSVPECTYILAYSTCVQFQLKQTILDESMIMTILLHECKSRHEILYLKNHRRIQGRLLRAR